VFEQLRKISLASTRARSIVTILTGLPRYLECHSLVSYCITVCEKYSLTFTKTRHICKPCTGSAKPIRQHHIQKFVTGMCCEFCLCVVSLDLKTSVSAALSYSDTIVSILLHISSLNVIFCGNVLCLILTQNLTPTNNWYHFIFNNLHTYILLLSAVFTVLVLLVCKCG